MLKEAVGTFEAGVAAGDLEVETPDGIEDAPVDQWTTELGPAEDSVLGRCRPRVLDAGCGPGRLAGWLARHGVDVLGVDVSEEMVALTREKGAEAVVGDVFSLDEEGTFATVVLVDGNVGIGGDPIRLLKRCRELLAPDGRILCEFAPPSTRSEVTEMRLRSGDDVSDPFPWAVVSIVDALQVSARAGLGICDSWKAEGEDGEWRHFAALSVLPCAPPSHLPETAEADPSGWS